MASWQLGSCTSARFRGRRFRGNGFRGSSYHGFRAGCKAGLPRRALGGGDAGFAAGLVGFGLGAALASPYYYNQEFHYNDGYYGYGYGSDGYDSDGYGPDGGYSAGDDYDAGLRPA